MNLISKTEYHNKLKIIIPIKLPFNNERGLYTIKYAHILSKKELIKIINQNPCYKYLLNFKTILLFSFYGEKEERLIPLEYLYDNLRLYIFDLVYYQRYKDLNNNEDKYLDNLQKLSKEMIINLLENE
jgi:hypothetical protein